MLKPGQITQKNLVLAIMAGMPVKKIQKKFPILSFIAIATVYCHIKAMRLERGLDTPKID